MWSNQQKRRGKVPGVFIDYQANRLVSQCFETIALLTHIVNHFA